MPALAGSRRTCGRHLYKSSAGEVRAERRTPYGPLDRGTLLEKPFVRGK
jgi:hypothetical protein